MELLDLPEGSSHLTEGVDRLDSWSTDGHKLLNVAYDCGIAICRLEAAHHAAMSVRPSSKAAGMTRPSTE